MYGNLSISIQDMDTDTFLYQLTQDIPYPINSDIVIFKDAPFLLQFLTQMQKEGLLIKGLQRRTFEGKVILLGRIQRISARS